MADDRRGVFCALFLLPGLLVQAPAVTAQTGDSDPALPQPLGEEQAVQIGLQHNPQVTAAQAGVVAASASYQSNRASLPVELGINHVLGSSSALSLNGLTTDTFVDLSDTLDTSGQRRLGAAAAHEMLHWTSYQLAETMLTLAQQIRDAYWSLVSARAQTIVARETLDDAVRVTNLTHLQFTAGAAPQVDVIRSSVGLANAQLSVVSAQGTENGALTALNTLLARPSVAPLTLADSMAESSTAPTLLRELPSIEALTRTALNTRPLVLATRALVRSNHYTVQQTRASRNPDLAVSYERSVQVPSQSALLRVQLPLIDFGSVRNSIKAVQATENQAQFQERQAEQQVAQQVAQAYTDFTVARALAGIYPAQILRPSALLLDRAQIGYKQGATGILPVLDAETTLRNARAGYIGALLALYKARDELEAALGGPVPSQRVPLKP